MKLTLLFSSLLLAEWAVPAVVPASGNAILVGRGVRDRASSSSSASLELDHLVSRASRLYRKQADDPPPPYGDTQNSYEYPNQDPLSYEQAMAQGPANTPGLMDPPDANYYPELAIVGGTTSTPGLTSFTSADLQLAARHSWTRLSTGHLVGGVFPMQMTDGQRRSLFNSLPNAENSFYGPLYIWPLRSESYYSRGNPGSFFAVFNDQGGYFTSYAEVRVRRNGRNVVVYVAGHGAYFEGGQLQLEGLLANFAGNNPEYHRLFGTRAVRPSLRNFHAGGGGSGMA